MICERCSDETHSPEKCNYCGKMICRNCEKSSKRSKKIGRTVICKSCWGNLGKRKKFKSA